MFDGIFYNENHKTIHDTIGDIVSDCAWNSEAIREVRKYLAEVRDLSEKDKLKYFTASICAIIHSSLAFSYDTVMKEFGENNYGFEISNAFISLVANQMWNGSNFDFSFSKEKSTHEDKKFIDLMAKNYTNVIEISSMIISLYFLNQSCNVPYDKIYEILNESIKERNVTIEIMFLCFYFMMEELNDCYMKVKAFHGSFQEIVSEMQENEKKENDFEIDFDGKKFQIVNKTKQ